MTRPTVHQLNEARRKHPASTEGKLQRLDVADLLSRPEPAIDWLWDGYLEEGTVAQLHGDGGSGKSIFALALARAIAGGYGFLGRDTWIERVVVIDGENPTGEVHRRLSRVGFQSAAERLHFWQAEDAIFNDLAEAETLIGDLVVAANAGLVVIDSQRALWYGDEKEAAEVRPFYAMLRRVANTTATAVLVLHHDRRTGGYSGSSDLNAGVDSRLHLIRDEDGTVTLKHEKLRSAVEQPPLRYRLHLEGSLYAFALEQSRTPRGDVLAALTGEWQTAPEIAKTAGVRRDEVENLLLLLTRSGDADYAVGPSGRSPRAKCWRLLVPTRDESGRVPHGDPFDHSSHDPLSPGGRGVGTSQGRGLVPDPDEYGGEWVDPVDADLDERGGR